MKSKTISYRSVSGAVLLLFCSLAVLIVMWLRTVEDYERLLNSEIKTLSVPSLTHHQFTLVDAVISNSSFFTEHFPANKNLVGSNLQGSIIKKLVNPSLNGIPGDLLFSTLTDHLQKMYSDEEVIFIYMSLPLVGGQYTLQELSLELFHRKIHALDDRELALLFAAGLNADSDMKFSEIHKIRVLIVEAWNDLGLITDYEHEQALSWMPNQILRNHRSFGYYHIIERAAYRHGIDPVLMLALVQAESAGNPGAVSRAGALGLAQLMPATASELRPGIQIPYQLLDPELNIELGAEYLAKVLSWSRNHFEHSSEDEIINFALAAYNAGWSRVLRANGIPNIRETRAYVQRVNWYYQHFSKVLHS